MNVINRVFIIVKHVHDPSVSLNEGIVKSETIDIYRYRFKSLLAG